MRCMVFQTLLPLGMRSATPRYRTTPSACCRLNLVLPTRRGRDAAWRALRSTLGAASGLTRVRNRPTDSHALRLLRLTLTPRPLAWGFELKGFEADPEAEPPPSLPVEWGVGRVSRGFVTEAEAAPGVPLARGSVLRSRGVVSEAAPRAQRSMSSHRKGRLSGLIRRPLDACAGPAWLPCE